MKNIVILCMLIMSLGACQQAHSEASTDNIIEEKPMAVSHAKFDYVEAKDAQNFIADNSAVIILDVRTAKEFTNGHIENAMNVDFLADNFQTSIAKLDRDTHYLLHCKSGKRSNGALKVMKRLGFTHITHMDGGFDAWKKAGLKIVK